MTALRLRLRSGRHPYGRLAWGYEVYDPAGPPNMQVLITSGWYPSWAAARNRGLAALRREQAAEDQRQLQDALPNLITGLHYLSGELGTTDA